MQMALIFSISWLWLASLSVPGIMLTPSCALSLLVFTPTYKVGSTIHLLMQMGKLRFREFRPPPQDDICVVQSLSWVWLFVTPWTAACQASLSFTISQGLLRLMSIESVKWSEVKSLSRVWLFATPWTAAYQASLSMGFSLDNDTSQ